MRKYNVMICIFLITSMNLLSTQQASIAEEKDTPSKSDIAIPMKKENIWFGDLILGNVWSYLPYMLNEIDKLTERVSKFENDLELVTYNLFKKKIEPARNLIKQGGNCNPLISNRLDAYLNDQISSVMLCLTSRMKNNFKFDVQKAYQSLDEYQIEITKEISLCELMDGEKQMECYHKTFEHAEDYKLKFISEYFIDIVKDAAAATDRLEGYWTGCAVNAMDELKMVNEVLEKELQCCQKTSLNIPCDNIDKILDKELKIIPRDFNLDIINSKLREVNNVQSNNTKQILNDP